MLPTVCPSQLFIQPRRLPKPMYLQDGELEIIVGLIESVSPRTVIEFGVNVGYTAQALLANIPSIERYIGIDVLPGYKTVLRGQQKEVPINPGYLVQGDARFQLISKPRGSFDLHFPELPPCQAVFIDGDHSYDAVLNDSHLASHCLQSPGMIVWHDYGNPTVEVTQALEDLQRFDHHHIFSVERTWLAFEKF